MPVAGYRREVDLSHLGPMLVVASSLILAIRTAHWPRAGPDFGTTPDWDREVEQSVTMAHRIFAHLISKSPFLFPQRDVPLYEPGDESPK